MGSSLFFMYSRTEISQCDQNIGYSLGYFKRFHSIYRPWLWMSTMIELILNILPINFIVGRQHISYIQTDTHTQKGKS